MPSWVPACFGAVFAGAFIYIDYGGSYGEG